MGLFHIPEPEMVSKCLKYALRHGSKEAGISCKNGVFRAGSPELFVEILNVKMDDFSAKADKFSSNLIGNRGSMVDINTDGNNLVMSATIHAKVNDIDMRTRIPLHYDLCDDIDVKNMGNHLFEGFCCGSKFYKSYAKVRGFVLSKTKFSANLSNFMGVCIRPKRYGWEMVASDGRVLAVSRIGNFPNNEPIPLGISIPSDIHSILMLIKGRVCVSLYKGFMSIISANGTCLYIKSVGDVYAYEHTVRNEYEYIVDFGESFKKEIKKYHKLMVDSDNESLCLKDGRLVMNSKLDIDCPRLNRELILNPKYFFDSFEFGTEMKYSHIENEPVMFGDSEGDFCIIMPRKKV